ncbi:2Fe-2S iron-sulfur cluster-binding protein [Myxococcota bacterium]|nr:2Fe-2S iron-sulfur cluster-binding protein [Myxococcota bacterium]
MALPKKTPVELVRQRLREVARDVRDRAKARIFGPRSKYKEGDLLTVSFQGKHAGEVLYGTTILSASRAMKVDLDHFCGGCGSCGTCRVFVVAGAEHLSPIQMNEEITLGAEAARKGHRLACQAKVQGPVEVKIPDYFLAR